MVVHHLRFECLDDTVKPYRGKKTCGEVPPNVHGINPKAPQAERDVVRPGGRETTPSDGPPHKFHALPRLGGQSKCFTNGARKHPDFEAVGNKIT